MTKQEIFDFVAKFLIKQNQRSVENSQCLYRGPGDLKCAVGCLMTDEEYDKNYEGLDVGSLISRDYLPARLKSECVLLVSLQTAHDRAYDFQTDFKPNMEKVARLYELSMEVFNQSSPVSIMGDDRFSPSNWGV